MDKETVLGLVRHILTTFGGILATKGVIGTSDVEVAAGAIATIVGVVWSIIDKKQRNAPPEQVSGS